MTPAGHRLTDEVRAWGRTLNGPTWLARPRFVDEVPGLVAAAGSAGLRSQAIGLRRSYGDSGLNLHHAAIDMSGLDRVLAFDPRTGVVRAEAGLSLSELILRTAPQGWFPPTTPGTRFVTLGGAVANDVHGKNHHHAGAFGASVLRLGLIRSDRGLVEVAPDREPELFAATIGGLGLTGAIAWVELQLARIESTYLDGETFVFNSLEEFQQLAHDSEASFEHTVAWVDCLRRGGRARGFFSRANWRTDGRFDLHDDRKRISVPLDLPSVALNPLSLRAFNELVYRRQAMRPIAERQHYTAAFYPLDAIGGWNRLYGARGFFQYQCVTPFAAGIEPVREMLAAIAAAGDGSFLAVLKTFGSRPSPGLLSFPMPGFTLALDFPNRGEPTYRLLARLDEVVQAAGGRLYPAKDGRMSPSLFAAGYPRLDAFRKQTDPAFSSTFWRRMDHG